MKDSRERTDESRGAMEGAVAWLVRQFDLTTTLLAALAENDHRMDIDETTEHRAL